MLKSRRFWVRIVLIGLIAGMALFALSLRESPKNDDFEFREIADGFTNPTFLADDGTGRLFVTERTGKIWIIEDNQRHETAFLDIQDRVVSAHIEQGLLSIAFDPEFSENGYFYLNYTGESGMTRIVRYVLDSPDSNTADPQTETLVMSIDQPGPNHNGGLLMFGPDGYLYIGVGDGGGDFRANAQDLTTPLGSILRIDVAELPYSIPEDNPFVDLEDARPEIWAYGLRNPWRFSIDQQSNMIFIADVGDEQFEEINAVPLNEGGHNFGWSDYESLSLRNESLSESERAEMTFPIFEYPHDRSGIDARVWNCSITGGQVYRGDELEDFQGHYIYGDWCSGTIWTLRQNDGAWVNEEFMQTAFRINSFAQDAEGELYLITHLGAVLKLYNR